MRAVLMDADSGEEGAVAVEEAEADLLPELVVAGRMDLSLVEDGSADDVPSFVFGFWFGFGKVTADDVSLCAVLDVVLLVRRGRLILLAY